MGWYRLPFDVTAFDPQTQCATLLFDGAMSEARVYVNGKEACFWPNGYNAFHCDITELLHRDGRNNLLAVRLENRPQSSRWYPGAGLYRNVRLIVTKRIHIPVWGTYVTTPKVTDSVATVCLRSEIAEADGRNIGLQTEITDSEGRVVASDSWEGPLKAGETVTQYLTVKDPQLWSPETPRLYTATTHVLADGNPTDTYTTRFGIRSIEYRLDGGFLLNGTSRKFQGVCNHHDLGPLGAAVNRAALRRQLTLLKEMGCDAIRTAHNMPATELAELCDEMGFMMMIEPFDEWDVAKCANGYHRFFAEWAEKDLVNMVRHFRNHPSVVMWSIGNEVPTQVTEGGCRTAAFLRDICHREDPTRPVTCGMDQIKTTLENGFAEELDITGINYRTFHYQDVHEKLPNQLVLGSETSSTVSSRGVYKFPVEPRANACYDDHQSSSYDVEYCSWSNIPDEDFALADDYPWTIGQFVWTGFDYLGEPSPYDTDAWPSHSSLFGIIDLAGIPKDRYYLYRSLWNTESPTLHLLPHWTWPGREGKVIPVFVYTNYPSAELFINGRSYGRREKNNSTLMNRYRLMWMNAVYEPGEVKVVAYDHKGNTVAEQSIRTAGAAARIELIPDRDTLSADGKDLSFIRVRVTDSEGNLCPTYNQLVKFSVEGAGNYRAAANGDATCLDPFHLPQMHAFSGELTAIVQADERPGTIRFTATAEGMEPATIEIRTR